MKNLILSMCMVALSTMGFGQVGAELIYLNDFNTYPSNDYTLIGWNSTTCTYTSCYDIIIDGSRCLTQKINNNFYESSVTFNEMNFETYDSLFISIDYKHYNITGITSLKLQYLSDTTWVTFSEVNNPSNSQEFVKKLQGNIIANDNMTFRILCTDSSPFSSSAFCIDNFMIYGYKQNYCSIDSDGNGLVQMQDLMNFLQYYSMEVNCN